jgi:hypothetical protein
MSNLIFSICTGVMHCIKYEGPSYVSMIMATNKILEGRREGRREGGREEGRKERKKAGRQAKGVIQQLAEKHPQKT